MQDDIQKGEEVRKRWKKKRKRKEREIACLNPSWFEM